jgi:PhoPQ-activated pathogenicity-related protein
MKRILSGVVSLYCAAAIVLSCTQKPVAPETALQAYLRNSDKTFKWEVREKYKEEGVTLYRILFTSQQWRGIEWNHEMAVIVPEDLEYNDALLFITGGSLKNGKPNIHDFK